MPKYKGKDKTTDTTAVSGSVTSASINSQNQSLFFQKLPVEIILHILSFLSINELTQVMGVCKLFQPYARDRSLWAPIFKRGNIIMSEEFKERPHYFYMLYFTQTSLSNVNKTINASDQSIQLLQAEEGLKTVVRKVKNCNFDPNDRAVLLSSVRTTTSNLNKKRTWLCSLSRKRIAVINIAIVTIGFTITIIGLLQYYPFQYGLIFFRDSAHKDWYTSSIHQFKQDLKFSTNMLGVGNGFAAHAFPAITKFIFKRPLSIPTFTRRQKWYNYAIRGLRGSINLINFAVTPLATGMLWHIANQLNLDVDVDDYIETVDDNNLVTLNKHALKGRLNEIESDQLGYSMTGTALFTYTAFFYTAFLLFTVAPKLFEKIHQASMSLYRTYQSYQRVSFFGGNNSRSSDLETGQRVRASTSTTSSLHPQLGDGYLSDSDSDDETETNEMTTLLSK